MLTLLSTLLGLLGSLIPNIVNIFQKKVDYAHELELKKLEYNAAREGLLVKRDIEDIRAQVDEGESIREHDNDIEYRGFWAGVRASIRPTITYAFFIVFVIIKFAAFSIMVDKGVPPMDLLNLVWDGETMAIFSAIMGFWFGSRAIERFSSLHYRPIPLGASVSTFEPTVNPTVIPSIIPNVTPTDTPVVKPPKPVKPNKPKKKPVRPLSDK